MKIPATRHEEWIFNHEKSGLFQCKNSGIDCANYHILSPVIYDLGINSTYDKYPLPIIRIVNEVIIKQKKADILVTGIENELSARALLKILDLFKDQFTITFIDICNTPLNRIKQTLTKYEQKYVSTLQCNFASDNAALAEKKFDIIISDLFLKQFARNKKIDILNIISGFLRNQYSAVIIREHFGDNNEIVDRWVKNKITSSELALSSLTKLSDNYPKIIRMINDLVLQFKTTGYVYPRYEDFMEDVVRSRLKINNQYYNKAQYHRIFHLVT